MKITQDSHMKIVITGHVDHGKSTLIGRILLDTDSLPKGKMDEIRRISRELGKETELAYITDQLKEEREEQKTIDTTQIFFRTRRRRYVIIDAPGHAEFIKNMLTGASSAETAVLVIDVAEGLKEQTFRHAYLLSLLGIDRVIVAVNKMDSVQYDRKTFETISNELSASLNEIGLKPVLIVPVSAREGDNIKRRSRNTGWYKGPALLEGLDAQAVQKEVKDRPMRFAVQDIYDVEGESLAAGKVVSGLLREGRDVAIMPSGKKSRISKIKVFGRDLKEAAQGESVGLILEGAFQVKRGDVLSDGASPASVSHSFKGNIFWLSQEPLKIKKPYIFRCSTQEAPCVVEKIERRIDTSTFEVPGRTPRNCR